MSAPRWSRALLRWLAPRGREDEILGDLEETHRARVRANGRALGGILSGLESLDLAFALLRHRRVGVGVSLLDFKLGLRMLARYPGLTALGGLAIAFAIFIGAGTFEFLSQVAYPKLPFEGGDRLVALELWNVREGGAERRAVFDYGVWRDELTAVEELGAFRSVRENLILGEGGAYLVTGAAMTASGFRLTGVEPVLGRTLGEEDERPGAPEVVVVGHELWRNLFGSDPDVVGRVVRLGSDPVTVVGVMPEGYAFPVAHQFWRSLRLEPETTAPGEGPPIRVFGRLTRDTSMEAARAEVTRIGGRLASGWPETHEHLRTFVQPYTRAMLGLPATFSDRFVSLAALSWNLPVVLFLVLVCGNVALLLFARAAAREGELVVRTALGASRRRIVGQLFAEALVLAVLGGALGLAMASYGLRWGYYVIETELWEGPLPFWFHPDLSIRTVVYILGLTMLGAVVAGVIPGLKATRGLAAQLREGTAGAGGFRFGGIWTAVIVAQIALTMACPMVALVVGLEGRGIQTFDMGIPAHEYLTAQVTVQPADPRGAEPDGATEPLEARVRATFGALEDRLAADARVAGVTFADHAPRIYAGWNQIEVDGPTAPPQDERGHRMASARVETDFFTTLGVEARLGRNFHPADAEEGSRVAIVNEAFVDYVMGGRNAIGVHFRYVSSERYRVSHEEPGPWHEIIGVVQDLGSMSGYSSAVIYHPVPDRTMNPAYAIIHVPGDAAGFTSRLREVAFEVDPALRIQDPLALDRMVDSTVEFYRFWVWSLVMVSAVAVLLSLGGIYSVMSFTVARRTREIGVRVALGAPRRRILIAVFRRPLIQLALGVVSGGLLAGLTMGLTERQPTLQDLAGFGAYVALMTGVCLLACVAPTRRALGVEPSEALRSE